MKTLGIIIIVLSSLFIVGLAVNAVRTDYIYKKEYSSYWNLADKASTIPQKSEYIDKFVFALESSNLQGTHDAVFLKTPNNSFDGNLEALKSLQLRLKEISKMDVSSFEYQTAIQQITAQEQGEAHEMLRIFRFCWYLHYHPLLWKWISALSIMFAIFVFVCGMLLKQ